MACSVDQCASHKSSISPMRFIFNESHTTSLQIWTWTNCIHSKTLPGVTTICRSSPLKSEDLIVKTDSVALPKLERTMVFPSSLSLSFNAACRLLFSHVPRYICALTACAFLLLSGVSCTELDVVTCGSVLKLQNIKFSSRLHSHDVKYGSGSGQQSVTGVESVDDHNRYVA